jgi:hypothetical protein
MCHYNGIPIYFHQALQSYSDQSVVHLLGCSVYETVYACSCAPVTILLFMVARQSGFVYELGSNTTGVPIGAVIH